jgi:hypothetical protein
MHASGVRGNSDATTIGRHALTPTNLVVENMCADVLVVVNPEARCLLADWRCWLTCQSMPTV